MDAFLPKDKITFNYLKDDFSIKKTEHLYKHRYDDSKYFRDEFISDSIYIEIMKKAISGGLRSFSEKGPVVLIFKNYTGRYVYILCKIKRNKIIIITVYTSFKKEFWKQFVKVNNRIYLVNSYEIPKMTKPEIVKKRQDKIKKDVEVYCRTQDTCFSNYMDLSGVVRI